jgi:hypothetical protein
MPDRVFGLAPPMSVKDELPTSSERQDRSVSAELYRVHLRGTGAVGHPLKRVKQFTLRAGSTKKTRGTNDRSGP